MNITELRLALDRFLVSRPYYPCCLLVYHDLRHLRLVSESLAAANQWPVLSIGATLSAALLSIAPQQRTRASHAALVADVRPFIPQTLLCTDIDLLFEPALALDPLRLLRATSRLTPLVVLWPGSASGETLAYAVPTHAHYRIWSRLDVAILRV